MIKPRLPRFCVFDPDRRGNERYYVRKKGAPKIRIKAAFESRPGEISKAFMEEYWAALAVIDGSIAAAPTKETPREDTFDWLCDRYFRSEVFQRFDRDTQRDKRSVLLRFCETAGKLPYKKYRKEDMEKSQLKRRDTPGAADKLVKVIKALYNWASTAKLFSGVNPAIGVKPINVGSEGFHTWTPEEVDQFREFYALGTKPRLAMEIMLNIGARLSDAVGIGPRNETVINGRRWLRFTVKKNRKRFGAVTIEAPMTAELIEAVKATKDIGSEAYLVTSFGKPFVTAGLGNKMRDWCNDAHLPDCSSHGLRKAAAVALAENGASAPELCAIFGWTNLRTAQIYIDKANKRRMTANAFRRRERATEKESVSLLRGKKANGTNEGKGDEKSKGK